MRRELTWTTAKKQRHQHEDSSKGHRPSRHISEAVTADPGDGLTVGDGRRKNKEGLKDLQLAQAGAVL